MAFGIEEKDDVKILGEEVVRTHTGSVQAEVGGRTSAVGGGKSVEGFGGKGSFVDHGDESVLPQLRQDGGAVS